MYVCLCVCIPISHHNVVKCRPIATQFYMEIAGHDIHIRTNFWRHDKIVDVMTYFWSHDKVLTSWRILASRRTFWLHANYLTSWRTFLTSWRTIWRQDVFLKSSWRDPSWRICYVIMIFFDVMTYFDVMTNFSTSWSIFDFMTCFYFMGYFLRHDELFDVMTYLWQRDWSFNNLYIS